MSAGKKKPVVKDGMPKFRSEDEPKALLEELKTLANERDVWRQH